ncbi:MAG: DUF3237 domain-containing protein [Pseudomonadales bacterium]|jgi:hypothetical protein|nr:DUF3237 domain-containing protein [Pseudomonadales bacterium]MDP6470267.1 DUF3237 domain-containing protein [Pseudomonadales bacterium]MDP6827173.1 DUF3237 domain-containing protein [Pseudomonadales bacterium]MDP6972396.1 DUF3237 domain-containing protein [Pseudomonadales bacterium]|tara:strand:+ start:803 stop:1246 length:444 start_codon:yes stop_codon:yes gene_type:complete
MKLTHLFDYHADLKEPQAVGRAQFGTRMIYDVTGGTFEGPRARGHVLPSGADWLLIDDEGVGRLDVRATFETDDGALIYMQYFGVVMLPSTDDEELIETQYGDLYFMTQPRFETADERYAWLNGIVAVAQGRTLPGAVEYRVYALEN